LKSIRSAERGLPPWSNDIERLRLALAEPTFKAGQLSRLLSSNPAMVVRILRADHSPLFGDGSPARAELSIAIRRLGRERMQCLTFATALAQLHSSPRYLSARKASNALADASVQTAAAAWLVARRLKGVAPEQAMLAGLLSGIGRLFLLYDQQSEGASKSTAHAAIAQALAQQFKLPEWLSAALAVQDQFNDDTATLPTMSRVLAASVYATSSLDVPADTARQLAARSGIPLGESRWQALLAAVPGTANALRLILND
jgi:HD-like signal output (HDOD) protein